MVAKTVAVMIPKTGYSYDREFMESYTHAKNWLFANYEKVPFEFGLIEYFCHTFPIDANRNECVAWAIENKVDITIWLDTDQEFPRDTLLKLLQHDLPIVAGIYHAKSEPYHPIVFRENGESTNFNWFNPIIDFPEKELFEADMIGMGCVAIKGEVLKQLEMPFFKYRPQPSQDIDKDEYRKFKHKWGVNDVSEDVWFWKQVREKTDYRIVIDPTIDVQHIGRLKVGRWLWNAYREGVKKGIAEKHGEEYLKKLEAKACQPSQKSAS